MTGTGLSYADVSEVLLSLADAFQKHHLVLVGGQAVNFWAEHYLDRVDALAREAPFTSKDLDFLGTRHAVEECANALNGRAFVADLFAHTPEAGVVYFKTPSGREANIDILRVVHGVKEADIRKTAIAVDLLDGDNNPVGVRFGVMHPLLCLESRVMNILDLAGDYDTELGNKQLWAAFFCTRELIRERAATDPRKALKLIERLFRFSVSKKKGIRLYQAKGFNLLDMLEPFPGLPDQFGETRLSKMREEFASKAGIA